MNKKAPRATRMRDYMARDPKRNYTLLEIRDAIEPGADLNLISGSMTSLVNQRDVLRIGGGPRHVSYRLNISEATGKPQRGRATPPPTAASRQSITGIARKGSGGRSRGQPTNFMAAPGTVETTCCPHRAASLRISADIAAFVKRGGRIQKLGTTKLFHHPANLADHDD